MPDECRGDEWPDLVCREGRYVWSAPCGSRVAMAGDQLRAWGIPRRGHTGTGAAGGAPKAAFRRRRVRDLIQHEIVADAGHTFNPPAAQRELRALLHDYVSRETRDARRARVESSRAVETSIPHTPQLS